jgi:hypothetical protein
VVFVPQTWPYPTTESSGYNGKNNPSYFDKRKTELVYTYEYS